MPAAGHSVAAPGDASGSAFHSSHGDRHRRPGRAPSNAREERPPQRRAALVVRVTQQDGPLSMFWKVYLIAYFALLGAALFALWQGRVLGRLPAAGSPSPSWAAVVLGVLLAVVSRHRLIRRPEASPARRAAVAVVGPALSPLRLARIVFSRTRHHATTAPARCCWRCWRGAAPRALPRNPRSRFTASPSRAFARWTPASCARRSPPASSSRLPWGKKALFDRSKFEADLERIRAFYVDRGFPDARVTSFDVKLNKQEHPGGLVDHGRRKGARPGGGDRFRGHGGRAASAACRNFDGRAPLKDGQPLDRAALAATREMVANDLRDHGYPVRESRRAEPVPASIRTR